MEDESLDSNTDGEVSHENSTKREKFSAFDKIKFELAMLQTKPEIILIKHKETEENEDNEADENNNLENLELESDQEGESE